MGRRAQHAIAPSAPKDDGQGGFTDYQKLALREFRYHPNPRGRFMARDLDPNDPQGKWSTVGAEHWTDYDIPMPNGDFDVTFDLQGDPVESQQMRYLEGFDLPAQQTVSTGATRYLHGDLIRSTVMTTNDSGASVASVAYTAFGELIGSAPETRYQYAGGWGYEADLLVLNGAPGTTPITLQHVGFRWYDPSLGRFIQRDPIGLAGGLNVYAYVTNNPLIAVDPSALGSDFILTGAPPPPWINWPKVFIWVTGGRHCWLDDPVKVRKAQKIAADVALVCILGAGSPYVGIAVGIGVVIY